MTKTHCPPRPIKLIVDGRSPSALWRVILRDGSTHFCEARNRAEVLAIYNSRDPNNPVFAAEPPREG